MLETVNGSSLGACKQSPLGAVNRDLKEYGTDDPYSVQGLGYMTYFPERTDTANIFYPYTPTPRVLSFSGDPTVYTWTLEPSGQNLHGLTFSAGQVSGDFNGECRFDRWAYPMGTGQSRVLSPTGWRERTISLGISDYFYVVRFTARATGAGPNAGLYTINCSIIPAIDVACSGSVGGSDVIANSPDPYSVSGVRNIYHGFPATPTPRFSFGSSNANIFNGGAVLYRDGTDYKVRARIITVSNGYLILESAGQSNIYGTFGLSAIGYHPIVGDPGILAAPTTGGGSGSGSVIVTPA